MERPSSKHLRIVLGVIAGLALIGQIDFSRQVISYVSRPEQIVRVPFQVGAVPSVVSYVEPEAEQAGLRKGMHIRTINGQPLTGLRLLSRTLEQARVGDTLTVGTDEGTFRIRLAPSPKTLAWVSILLFVIVPAGCLGFGTLITWLRPFDVRAWILFALLMSFVGLFSPGIDAGRRPAPLMLLGIFFRMTLSISWAVWMVQLALRFPVRFPGPRWFHRLGWALMVMPAISALVVTGYMLLRLYDISAASAIGPWVRPLQGPGVIASMIAVGFYFAAINWHAVLATQSDVRRRLQLLRWGSYISMTPVFLVLIRSMVQGAAPFAGMPNWLEFVVLCLQLLFPLTLAYIVIVERALDVRVVLRMGLRYALARRALIVIQVLIGVTAGTYLYEAVRDDHVSWIPVVLLLGLVASVQPLSQRLNQWLDRRFFRDAYNADHILSDLSEQVKSMVETQPLLETVAQRISEALHVPKVAMMLRGQNGSYEPAFALGYAAPFPMAASQDIAAIEKLRASRQPLTLHNPEEELPALNARLLLPLGVKDELIGFIGLGEKLSEEPYSPADLRLLKSVAAQTALALENAQLTSTVAHQLAAREQFDREMTITRDVQQRLFPQKRPAIEGLVYDGYCRPAQSVGGDYFDFMELPGNQLLLAIGDVSGKGMPAALLMAALQASVRGQAMNNVTDLEIFARNVNLLLYEMSPRSHFATLFLGLYDPRTWRLRYVLAGHNPPLVLRSRGQMDFLQSSGPGVGMTRLATFTPHLLQMDPGDLLVAYTDGFTEAMDATQDQFGELRLMEAVRAARRMEPRVIIDRAMEAVDAFTAGSAQHDDMTMVVLEVR